MYVSMCVCVSISSILELKMLLTNNRMATMMMVQTSFWQKQSKFQPKHTKKTQTHSIRIVYETSHLILTLRLKYYCKYILDYYLVLPFLFGVFCRYFLFEFRMFHLFLQILFFSALPLFGRPQTHRLSIALSINTNVTVVTFPWGSRTLKDTCKCQVFFFLRLLLWLLLQFNSIRFVK